LPEDPLGDARHRWEQGDTRGTLAILEAWFEHNGPRGRTADAAHLLAGMAHFSLQNHNRASFHFYRVRRTDRNLAPYGAYYEALADHKRGRHSVAITECEQYRQRWPDGIHADDCLILSGDAYGALGRPQSAQAAYAEFLEDNPDTPRAEELRVAHVRAKMTSSAARATPAIIELTLNHGYPSTDLAASQMLETISDMGIEAVMPSDAQSLMRRCASLKRSGKLDEAWALFEQLANDETDPVVVTWVANNEDKYAWGTRHFDVYASNLEEDYLTNPSADTAWKIFRAHVRGGQWDSAVIWGERGLTNHGSHSRWRSARDDVAQAIMLSGNYSSASDRWGALSGQDARFYEAFSAYKADEFDKADAAFSAVINSGSSWTAAAYYWRGKSRLNIGHPDAAARDLEMAAEIDKTGWYRLLQQQRPADSGWRYRDGSWRGSSQPTLPQIPGHETQDTPSNSMWPEYYPIVYHNGKGRQGLSAPTDLHIDWSALAWPHHGESPITSAPVQRQNVPISSTVGDLPNGYVASKWFDPKASARVLHRVGNELQDTYPEFSIASDLANAGQHGEAARLLEPLYETWRSTGEGPELPTGTWRQIFLSVRSHYNATRFHAGLGRSEPDEIRAQALRLAYPVVRPPELWRHSEEVGIDPLLMMAIMRQESTYREFIVSHAGAIGLVQVMPRTGALVAALMGEQSYSPRDLENPSTNIRYGTYYLSKLMERFGGVFPLAVASYNGGPHNVSRWLTQINDNVTLAEFVELIPYSETRDYVKRVSSHYAVYVSLYGAPDAFVALPQAPGLNDPTVIDF